MRSLVRLTVVLLGGVWHLSSPNRVRPMPPALERSETFLFLICLLLTALGLRCCAWAYL